MLLREDFVSEEEKKSVLWILRSLFAPVSDIAPLPNAPSIIMEHAKHRGLTLLLYHLATTSSALRAEFSEDQWLWLKQNYYFSLVKVTGQQEAIRDLFANCAALNLPVVLLRGQALGVYYYPDAALRPSWDVDLLLPPNTLPQFDLMVQDLTFKPRLHHGEIGYYREQPPPLHLDIHTELWYETDGTSALESCTEMRDFFGTPCRILRPEEHLIHLLAHAVFHHARFSIHDVIDMAFILQRSIINWDLLYTICRGSTMKTALTAVLDDISNLLNLPIKNISQTKFKYTRGQQLAIYLLKKLIRPYDRPLVGHLLRPFSIAGLNHQVRFLWTFLFPDSNFIRRRYGAEKSRSVLWWRLLRPLILIFKSIYLAIFHLGSFAFGKPVHERR